MIKYFWMPAEVWYYVIIPILLILLTYAIFTFSYRKHKEDYYYNYVVDYVYSSLGIIFCSLLVSLLLGYSVATIKILYLANILKNNILPLIILIILPIIPTCFLVYVARIYIKNLKRKEKLDENLEKIKELEPKKKILETE